MVHQTQQIFFSLPILYYLYLNLLHHHAITAFIVPSSHSFHRVTKQTINYRSSRYLHSLPDENALSSPSSSANPKSLSNIPYSTILSGIDRLYPPQSLSQRNALSRTDGYWPFIKTGDSEPPLELTYGEWDIPFFAELLDKSRSYRPDTTWNDKFFLDIGSGMGRLVIGASVLYRWKQCRGVEILKGLHDMAVDIVTEHCRTAETTGDDDEGYQLHCLTEEGSSTYLPMSPIQFFCGSIENEDIRDVDCAFVASSCMPSDILSMIARTVGRQCKPGTIVITTDYEFPVLEGMLEDGKGYYRLELLERVDGYCWVVGGDATGYIYRVVESGGG